MDLKTFLKKIFGTLEREVQTEVNRAKNTAKQQVRSTVTQATRPTQSTQQTTQPKPQPQYTAPEPTRDRSESEWHAYFKGILAQEFSQYAVRENVPVKDLAGDESAEFKLYENRPQQAYKPEWGLPYTFVLFTPEGVKGLILLGKSQSQYKHVKFMISKMYAKKMGVPFISFYMDAPNERDYVVDRIRKYLR